MLSSCTCQGAQLTPLAVQASLTVLLGMLLGWAWGSMSMAAGQAARDKTLLALRYQAAQQAVAAGPPGTTVQTLVFDGFFLDTRTSATYGALFFIGCFALGAIRAHAPKLTLLCVSSRCRSPAAALWLTHWLSRTTPGRSSRRSCSTS